MQEWLQDIEQHFKDNYPREGCGILGVVKGRLKWFPCDNVAEDENDFIIDSRQYIEVSQRADIVGIVHSHPDYSCEPSEADIKSCNAINIPYYIFSYPEMDMHILQPNKQEKSLYGRNYEFGVSDCFEAARDYYIKEGLDIPNRPPFEDNWWEKGIDYFTDEYIKTWGFVKVTGPMKEGDLLIFTIQENVPDHCGVYLGEDIFYHHAENRLSCRESLFPFWKKYITGVYRYDA